MHRPTWNGLLLGSAMPHTRSPVEYPPFQDQGILRGFPRRYPMRNLTHDDRDRDPHSPDAGSSAHNLGIKGDAIKHFVRPLRPTPQRPADLWCRDSRSLIHLSYTQESLMPRSSCNSSEGNIALKTDGYLCCAFTPSDVPAPGEPDEAWFRPDLSSLARS